MSQSPETTTISREEFLQILGNSGLFSQEELHKTLSSMPVEESNLDAPEIARQLTAAGKLTRFQADALLDHKVHELLLGNYEVLARLGAGGMGTVFKARHRRMKRVVAIKVLAKSIALDENFLKRFQREVETVARLSHPNIVMAFDADEAEAGPFLVMEFVNGRDLATRVQESGPLPVREAVDCILQSARGLVYAHGQNIVHRDIKPANLLLDDSGVVKVADLGLARLNDSASAPSSGSGSLTTAGSVVGTVDFMAPEQAEDSTTINHRADIYSLGCTLYFLLTGKPPFVGASLMGTLMKHRTAAIPSLRSVCADIPAALDALFKNMLAKQPADRCSSMAEIVSILEGLLPSLPNIAPVATAPVSQRAAASPSDSTMAWGSVEQLSEATRDTATLMGGIKQVERPSTQIPVLVTLNVLLVEPSRTQAVIVRKYLQDLGITNVQTSASGVKAIASVKASPPQVVISALHLDDSSGVQLAHQVRSDMALANVGFILISSEGDSIEVDTLLRLPRTILLRKPFDLEKLKVALRQATA